ncbi:MAG: dihydrolipoyl dehydrogenase [Holosporales bacterium]|jgi:dihydrolipoamide dehydrogenase|nr:dihydrolipoyl dehydrogenase [Holosporales bacterium]
MDFDVIVIGGGPGGYVAAIRASELGLKTALVEMDKLGGTCLNRGCIPTKSLLHSADVKALIERVGEFGIKASVDSVDLEFIKSRTGSIIDGLNSGVSNLMSANNISVIHGVASFKNTNTLVIKEDGKQFELTAKNIVIATGAVPRIIPGTDLELLESGLIWTSKEALSPNVIPKKLAIIGSGAIGIELATFYHSMGANVTVSEIQDRILPTEDREISDYARRLFVKKGINIRLQTKSQNFKEKDGKIEIEFIDHKNKTDSDIFDIMIMAIGVVPNISSLNLDIVNVELTPKGTIKVFEYQETSQRGIYAIGDVAETPWLAHKASREGVICAERIAGLSKIIPINLRAIPSCIYSSPQVASIGLTEGAAIEDGYTIKVGKSYFKGSGKAAILGETDGFIKLIFDAATGELLGAHMIGSGVTELISIASIAIAGELTIHEMLSTVFPHPTMSESLHEAVASAFYIHSTSPT